jgi:broad specificity phosphatase PhoE
MTILHLVRHGETTWHDGNRYAGRTDVPLTERGRRQAEQLTGWARRAGLDAVWTSPLSRARETAAAIPVESHVDERLTELDFGDAEGLTSAEMRDRFPEARRAFEADPVRDHLPGGEDPVLAADRLTGCVEDIVAAHPDGRVLVVGHSTAHRLLLCRLLGLPLSSYRAVFPAVRNCAITTVRRLPGEPAALIEFNVPPDAATEPAETTR